MPGLVVYMFALAGRRIQLHDFTEADRQTFMALSQDEANFTYTKARITEDSGARTFPSDC